MNKIAKLLATIFAKQQLKKATFVAFRIFEPFLLSINSVMASFPPSTKHGGIYMKYLRTLFNLLVMVFCISMPLSHAIAADESPDKAVKQSTNQHKAVIEKNDVKEGKELVSEKEIQGKGSININTANAEQLVKELNGVGAKKAQAIIEYREKYGQFTAIEQLQEVQGIGPALMEKNWDKLTY
ncbi:ComEA family DNA-binding protein [Xenorhabdus bovienii]